MLAKVLSCAVVGLEGTIVEVEVDISPGLPAFNIVGLPDTAVQEAKERVRAAIKNSGLTFPAKRITVNLAPADMKKEGPGRVGRLDPEDAIFLRDPSACVAGLAIFVTVTLYNLLGDGLRDALDPQLRRARSG